jgi:hypothetical protein
MGVMEQETGLTRLLGLDYLTTWHEGRRAFCGVRCTETLDGLVNRDRKSSSQTQTVVQ